jgi:hypothetical protein
MSFRKSYQNTSSKQPTADTSDAAYEKRHRKFEAFEKRQRLREKEQLKHEQYKLKERIDQLRAIDSAAFLALPQSAFSPIPSQPNEIGEGDNALNEGERRRKEMLEVALTLEARYRILLPSDRKKNDRESSMGGSAEPDGRLLRKERHLNHGSGESELDIEGPVVETAQKDREKIKLKIKVPRRIPLPSAKLGFPLPPTNPLTHKSATSASFHMPQHNSDPPSPAHSSSPMLRTSQSPIARHKLSSTLGIDEDVQLNDRHDGGDSISQFRPRKRRKRSSDDEESTGEADTSGRIYDAASGSTVFRSPTHSRTKPVSYAGAAGNVERTTSVLLISALRQSGAPKARKTQRHLTAFGSKIPPEVEEYREYVLPAWIVSQEMFKETHDHEPTTVEQAAYTGETPENLYARINGPSVDETEESQSEDVETGDVP